MNTLRLTFAHLAVIVLVAAAAPAQQADTQQELAEVRAELAKLKAELHEALEQVEQLKADQATTPLARADTEHTDAVNQRADAQLERLRVQQDRIEQQLDSLLERSDRDLTTAYNNKYTASAGDTSSASPFDYRYNADTPPSDTRIVINNAPAAGYSTYTTARHVSTGGTYVRYKSTDYTRGPVIYSTVSYTRPYYSYSRYYGGYGSCGTYGYYPYYRTYPRSVHYYPGYYPRKSYYHRGHSTGLNVRYRSGNFAIHVGGHKHKRY